MANSKAPKNDFAPAWLKIPSENQKPAGGKPSEHYNKSSNRPSRKDEYYNVYNHYAPDYGYGPQLQRQRSFDNYYDVDRRYHPQAKFRHHSVDDDYYGYNGYGYYPGPGFDKYHARYHSQPSLYGPHHHPGRSPESSKYQHPNARYSHADYERYGQMNGGGGYDYYAYYDYYGDYPEPHYGYGRPQGKRNFHERDGRPSPAKLEKEKSRDKEEEEEPSLEDDFPSLGGEGEVNSNGLGRPGSAAGVWEHPPSSKVLRGQLNNREETSTPNSEPAKETSSPSNIYKALVPNKNILTRKSSRDSMKLTNGHAAGVGSKEHSNGPTARIKTPPGSLTPNTARKNVSAVHSPALTKELPLRQSPTPAVDILNTCVVKQPKTLADKKSEFLNSLRKDTAQKDDGNDGSSQLSNEQDVNADDVCEEEEKEESGGGKLVNGFGSLSVGSPDCRQLLSSSLEAEQRLLREMGWNEADYDGCEITEDDKREFQRLSKKVKEQRNGFKRNLPNTLTPQQCAFKQAPVVVASELLDTISSDEDSDSDSD